MSFRAPMLTQLKTSLFLLAIGALAIAIGTNTELNAAVPLIKTAEGLFDQSQTNSLGLAPAKGEHRELYCATEDNYKFCHHANLGVFDGHLYAMWSNGITHEDHNGQRVLYCRSKNGLDWSKPEVLAEDPDGKEGEKYLMAAGFFVAGDQLVAYCSVQQRNTDRTELAARISSDGVHWSEPRRVVSGSFMNAPASLRSGRLLLCGRETYTKPLLMVSGKSDGISGWTRSELPDSPDLLYPEPVWFQRGDGTIVMLFRSRENNPWLYASTSSDDGRSWTKPAKTNFPDATARSSAGNLPDGAAFVVNNSSQRPNSVYPPIGRRIPLTVALSDDGVTFDRARSIRSEPTRMRFSGENKLPGWQYPHAVVWGEHLYVAYSVNKEDVAVTRIALDDLR